ncbi:Protein SON [Halotydeus destructor]|nr:Protein SON [Halotydeus destructor]
MEAAAYSDSSLSGSDIDSDDEVRSVISQVTFDGRHPFALKERKDIQIKIRNLPQIQARSAKEVQSELRSEFPVSSGNMHKHKQLEWKEVEQPGPLALMPPPMAPPPKTKKARTQEYPPPFAPPPEAEQPTTSGSTADSEVQPSKQTMDIGSIMAARISAMRVLEQDPQNAVALKQMEQANEMMTQWSTLQVMPGQFTGNTGVNLLTPDQLQGDRPAWTKGNEFRQAVALNGGIGKHLLLKMGWAEGTGLGRNNDGILEPIMPSLKLDTKGLKSEEEDKPTKSLPLQLATPPGIVAGSLPVIKHHPVAMLQEYCMKNKILIPEYIMVEESGPPHRPIFVMKVNVKNVWYQPTISASSKKIAKALAAAVACQAFNLLPKDCAI